MHLTDIASKINRRKVSKTNFRDFIYSRQLIRGHSSLSIVLGN